MKNSVPRISASVRPVLGIDKPWYQTGAVVPDFFFAEGPNKKIASPVPRGTVWRPNLKFKSSTKFKSCCDPRQTEKIHQYTLFFPPFSVNIPSFFFYLPFIPFVSLYASFPFRSSSPILLVCSSCFSCKSTLPFYLLGLA